MIKQLKGYNRYLYILKEMATVQYVREGKYDSFMFRLVENDPEHTQYLKKYKKDLIFIKATKIKSDKPVNRQYYNLKAKKCGKYLGFPVIRYYLKPQHYTYQCNIDYSSDSDTK